MRKKIILENDVFRAEPMIEAGVWNIYDAYLIGSIENGTFESFRRLSITEMLNVVKLMLLIRCAEADEEKVLKTKNEENGN